MTRAPQTAIPIPVIIVIVQDFCCHTGRLVQSDAIPNTNKSIPKRGWKKNGVIIES